MCRSNSSNSGSAAIYSHHPTNRFLDSSVYRVGSIPDAIEPAGSELDVLRGVADRFVPEVHLDLAQIAAAVSQRKTRRMAELMRMDQRQISFGADA